ncbi:type II toxin-antitoxin system HicB family antitoxin [Geobacter grbiciae]|uniref:type II toxin-antitoxin system HicB family antitoxin n=1 Tax=Geobacter grbiciae TaxID=155042 RepID=UPI001C023037|nr:hypothetical protein [Geobacter grbiciae]MBT1077189.1 hypothetical protein [Geobacter grbiciae]
MKIEYPAIITPAEEGGFLVDFPDFEEEHSPKGTPLNLPDAGHIDVAYKVLHGMTVRDCAELKKVSHETIRKIVFQFCERVNPDMFRPSLRYLRRHADKFISKDMLGNGGLVFGEEQILCKRPGYRVSDVSIRTIARQISGEIIAECLESKKEGISTRYGAMSEDIIKHVEVISRVLILGRRVYKTSRDCV